ncbi:hypothetical protein C1X61_15295 [Pseudomonas sp. FW215-T2]|nr:hypothetical protein C1X61_15295 [Pseudomonas sp. FW215-T2]PNA09861.1 hypothetical protein C1X62_20250 [Pseudomonas sp. FW215-R3]PNB34546.1 hypothetical protein C1X63_26750 [Pseudomonas sp. FW305-131]
MNCSPGDQAERHRTLGGPWNLEVKANVLDSPFPLQNNEMIDMVLLLPGNHYALRCQNDDRLQAGGPPDN